MLDRGIGRLGIEIVALALVLATAGCSLNRLQEPTIVLLHEKSFAPRPPDYPIAVTEADFKEPYVQLAQVTTSPYDDRMVDSLGEQELRELARRLGGDAVVQVVRNRQVIEEKIYRPWFGGWLSPGTRFVDTSSLTGAVVRFERANPAPAAPPPETPETQASHPETTP